MNGPRLVATMVFIIILGAIFSFVGLIYGNYAQYHAEKEQGRLAAQERERYIRSKLRASGDGWRVMGGVYRVGSGVNYVWVDEDKETDFEVYDDSIKSICEDGEWCSIVFFNRDFFTLRGNHLKFPVFTREIDGSTVATYIINPYKDHEEMLWSCRLVPDPSKCFN